MTHAATVSEKMFEVTYTYTYPNGTPEECHEEMTESRILQVEKLIAGGTTSWGATYSNLVIIQELGYTDVSNIETWYKLGLKNPSIKQSYDPEFSRNSFSQCMTIDTLVKKLRHDNWCLGQAFYYKNLCFINQIDGGGEWKVIRDDIAFESWSCGYVIRTDGVERFINRLNRMLAATDEQLRSLDYMDAGEVFQCEHCSKKMYPGSDEIFLQGTTCENCYINKKMYMDAIVTKVKSGEQLLKSDLSYIQYSDSFYGAGKGMEDNRGLIFWDNEVAIGYPYGARDAVDIKIYKPKPYDTANPSLVEWQLVDEYEAKEINIA
ncbi:hypothetical protein [Paenibacillus glucanolyticus]|uniref:hypothetical protein n=1 Tax=Paenibacillus glucanolyticus TaxID=59843 RepID=UPI00096C242D|nr:hypothetical protein [Paenibacillus glucanolyticus]OMF76735.1 hypothetical protein BK142_14540 [Paenibacillus glucanolyticus]